MTTVANAPVGPDSISSTGGKGKQSPGNNHPGFLGRGQTLGRPAQVSAGTPGGSVGVGAGSLPCAHTVKKGGWA